jgi:CTP:phosphocholine cytidylyltransferase-like protein
MSKIISLITINDVFTFLCSFYNSDLVYNLEYLIENEFNKLYYGEDEEEFYVIVKTEQFMF